MTVKQVLLVVAYRDLIDRYVDACKQAGITLAGIDLEAFALLRALQAPAGGRRRRRAGRARRRRDRPRALDVRRLGRAHLRVHARPRLGRLGAQRRARASARRRAVRGRGAQALPRAQQRRGPGRDGARAGGTGARRDDAARSRPSRASSSPRSSSTRTSPALWASARSSSAAARRTSPGLAEELERLIGVRVRVGDPLARMKVSKKVGEPEQIGSLAVAIGLGIED